MFHELNFQNENQNHTYILITLKILADRRCFLEHDENHHQRRRRRRKAKKELYSTKLTNPHFSLGLSY